MFDNLRRKLVEQRAAAALKQNPIVQMGQDAIPTFWSNQPSIRGAHSPEFVQNVAGQLMERVVKVAIAANPTSANREELVTMTSAAAAYQVSILDAPPVEDVTGLRGKLGITGELRPHIMALAKLDDLLAEEFHGAPNDLGADEYYGMCLLRYRQCHAAAHVHHQLRMAMDDYNPNVERDWFRPFTSSSVPSPSGTTETSSG